MKNIIFLLVFLLKTNLFFCQIPVDAHKNGILLVEIEYLDPKLFKDQLPNKLPEFNSKNPWQPNDHSKDSADGRPIFKFIPDPDPKRVARNAVCRMVERANNNLDKWNAKLSSAMKDYKYKYKVVKSSEVKNYSIEEYKYVIYYYPYWMIGGSFGGDGHAGNSKFYALYFFDRSTKYVLSSYFSGYDGSNHGAKKAVKYLNQ